MKAEPLGSKWGVLPMDCSISVLMCVCVCVCVCVYSLEKATVNLNSPGVFSTVLKWA